MGSLSPREHSTSAPRLARAFGVALASSGRRRVWHVPEGGPEASCPLASCSQLPRRAPSGPPRGPSLRRSPAVAVGAGRGRVRAKAGSRFWVLASPRKSLNEGLRVAGPLLRAPQPRRQASAAFPRGGRLRGVGSTGGQLLASARGRFDREMSPWSDSSRVSCRPGGRPRGPHWLGTSSATVTAGGQPTAAADQAQQLSAGRASAPKQPRVCRPQVTL